MNNRLQYSGEKRALGTQLMRRLGRVPLAAIPAHLWESSVNELTYNPAKVSLVRDPLRRELVAAIPTDRLLIGAATTTDKRLRTKWRNMLALRVNEDIGLGSNYGGTNRRLNDTRDLTDCFVFNPAGTRLHERVVAIRADAARDLPGIIRCAEPPLRNMTANGVAFLTQFCADVIITFDQLPTSGLPGLHSAVS